MRLPCLVSPNLINRQLTVNGVASLVPDPSVLTTTHLSTCGFYNLHRLIVTAEKIIKIRREMGIGKVGCKGENTVCHTEGQCVVPGQTGEYP